MQGKKTYYQHTLGYTVNYQKKQVFTVTEWNHGLKKKKTCYVYTNQWKDYKEKEEKKNIFFGQTYGVHRFRQNKVDLVHRGVNVILIDKVYIILLIYSANLPFTRT